MPQLQRRNDRSNWAMGSVVDHDDGGEPEGDAARHVADQHTLGAPVRPKVTNGTVPRVALPQFSAVA